MSEQNSLGASEADLAEQKAPQYGAQDEPLRPEDAVWPLEIPVEIPLEADPADAAEQVRVVELDDEEDYR